MNIIVAWALWAASMSAAEPHAGAVTGNGALTAGVGAGGSIVACNWPSPGYCSQAYRAGGSLLWGWKTERGIVWLQDGDPAAMRPAMESGSAVVKTPFSIPEHGVEGIVDTFVCAEADVLVSRIHIRGEGKPAVLYWFADLSPCTRLIPELPIAGTRWDPGADFAVFTPDEGKTLIHFRPDKPGAAQWEQAARLADGRAPVDEWNRFEGGVWIAYGSPNPPAGFTCGNEKDVADGLPQVDAFAAEARAAAGACYSTVALVPEVVDDAHVGTVFVAFGRTRVQAEGILAKALQQGYEPLQAGTDAYWRQWLSGARLPATANARLTARWEQDLVLLAQMMDRRTGAMARAPVAQPPLAMDAAEEGAWMSLALDLAGLHDLAEQHTLFYAGAVRKTQEKGMPYGSLPAAVYGNHEDGLPHFMLRVEAGAWVLGSMWRHAQGLDDTERRRAYLNKAWDTIEALTAFLTGWIDDRDHEPLHSYQPALGRDARPPELLLAAYMGIDSGIRAATELARDVPEEWRIRKTELEVAIRFRFIGPDGQWQGDAALPYWGANMAEEWRRLGASLPSWDGPVERRMTAPNPGNPADRMRAVCEAALVWDPHGERRAALLQAYESAPPPPFPDAYYAALDFVAGALLYPPR